MIQFFFFFCPKIICLRYFLGISALNNSSSLAAINLHHQIVDNERFMKKYAAANSGITDTQQRSKLTNDDSSAATVFSDQTRSKKLNQSSTIQSGTTLIVKHVSTFYKNINNINENISINIK